MPQEYFDKRYADNPDPWGQATRWYERRKYAITVASLPNERYRNCFEPGCGIGELTKLLAPRCDRLLAVDFARAAVARARAAVREFPHVQVEPATLPVVLPNDTYDLVVVSEILYYFANDDLHHLLDELLRLLEPGGHIVAAHWLAREHPSRYDGFDVHRPLVELPELDVLVHHEDQEFVLDVLLHKTWTV